MPTQDFKGTINTTQIKVGTLTSVPLSSTKTVTITFPSAKGIVDISLISFCLSGNAGAGAIRLLVGGWFNYGVITSAVVINRTNAGAITISDITYTAPNLTFTIANADAADVAPVHYSFYGSVEPVFSIA